ncbi:MAG: fibronectin type III domain-containing protein [Acetobacter sp.]|nr:fibronectin type III domain-containing protein [Bacteroides sp.]MCM1340985.1 fibronectin type III domain-containing protein [Acetobacter sp.]MCM1432459.1 fibronectin type III domain-containing protein [Clostridiales bacterium]
MKKSIFVSAILVIYMITACFTAMPVSANDISSTASYEYIDLDKINEIKDNQEMLDTVKTAEISYENDISFAGYLNKCNNLEKLLIKKATVKWKKVSGATGYQIQYSTSSKFKSAKSVTVGNNKTTSKTIPKLKAKKKYYVRIRTYKTVKVNGKNTKIYPSWSKAKSVTTKK